MIIVNSANVIWNKMKYLIISFILFLIACIGSLTISKSVYAKLFFIIMLFVLIILFIYYLDKFRNEILAKKFNVTEYNNFRHLYFFIFVPYFVIFNLIGALILVFTRSLLLSIIIFIIVESSSFLIYNKLLNSNKYLQ